ncbi:MAG: hypothetical protein KBT68_07520 [bacterium]|nr:hypothetical protein [Candidatus Colisoma equi]
MRNIVLFLSIAVVSSLFGETNAVVAATNALAAATVRRFIDTKIYKLNHASALEVADKFNAMWSGEFGQTWKVTKMAVAFEESNSIMITAPGVIQDACEQSIRELDIEAPQVYIEARFVELGNTASHKVGIDWSGLAGGVTFTGNGAAGLRNYSIGKGVKNYQRKFTGKEDGKNSEESYERTGANSGDGDISYFNGTLTVSQMSLTLAALDATEDAKTFSNPKIIVSSGKKAMVDMTTKYPNVKVSAKRSDSGGNATSLDIAAEMVPIPGEDKMMFAKEAFFSWGISMEVTPRIGTNGLINVSIVPTISSQEDWVETGSASSEGEGGTISSRYPVIKVQRLVSEFNLESGTTAVIGGLSITRERQADNGIPLLRDIPWIGPRLFGSIERVKEQKEIVVFVTVGLVDPRKMAPDAGLPKNAVLGRQYTKGQKLEPGDRPEKNMEGIDSLDMRLLEEQAKDPLKTQKKDGFSFSDYLPFTKDPDYEKDKK